MYARQIVPEAVSRLAAAQAGVVTRQQVLGIGMGPAVIKRLRAEGRWGNFEAGLYLVPNGEPSWLTRVWAGLLLGGPDARAGGFTAATLGGLSDQEQLPIEVLLPSGRRVADRSWVLFRQERTGVRAVSTRAQPPRTRIEDTVLDLCASASDSDCVNWLTAAVQRRLTTPASLTAVLERRARAPKRRLLQQALIDVASGVHSVLEHRYLHDVEQAHGLPRADRQHRSPTQNAFIDVGYLEYGLLVELDGRTGHVGEGRWRDRRRDNGHALTGFLTLRFGWHEVSQEPCGIATQVAEILIARGWGGYPGRCPRCR